MNKSEVIRNALMMGISMAGIYFFKGKKYINLSSFFTLGISFATGITITRALQKDNAGGTTPHNPLKIPAKKITPIR